jgi:hypothetical protein
MTQNRSSCQFNVSIEPKLMNSHFATISKTVSQLVIPKDTHKGHPYDAIHSKFKLVFRIIVSVESCAYPCWAGVTDCER